MKKGKWFLAVVLVASAAFLLTHISISQGDNIAKLIQDQLKNEYKPVSPLLPAGVTVKPGFEKGVGPDIGSAQMVQGEALVVHKGQSVAYKLKKGSPIFAGDMLVTKERSRLNAKMNDKSVIGLAPVSKLVIDKSVYDPKKNERSSFLSLMWGRARFIVSKLTKSKPNYQIKTPTAVCGVRGTDFAMAVTHEGAKFPSTHGKTSSKLNFISTAHAAGPVIVTVVVVGPNGTISVGTAQGTVTATELHAAYAAMGAAPGAPVAMPLAQVMATLNAVAPNLAALSMPPEFD